jgi:hypothetical protein
MKARVLCVYHLYNQNLVRISLPTFILQLTCPILFKAAISFHIGDMIFMDQGTIFSHNYLFSNTTISRIMKLSHLSNKAKFCCCNSRIPSPPTSLGKHSFFQAMRAIFFLW